MVQATPEAITNFLRIDDRITTSGQPDADGLKFIADLGVSNVLNLSFKEDLPDEVASVISLGMDYIHIPVQFEGPTDEDFAQFCEAMGYLKEEKIHIHCKMNYRVTAFLYRYRRDVLGLSEEEARAPMDKIWQPEGVWAEFVKPH